jgi:mycobactin lysine-N-oxygenase
MAWLAIYRCDRPTQPCGEKRVMAPLGFSWMAHLVRDGDERSCAEWVDGGSRRPSHQAFAAYLRDAIGRSGGRPCYGEVTALRCSSTWTVRYKDLAVGEQDVSGFDGVVVTSPGPQQAIGTLKHPRYLDGDSFWRHLPEARAAAEEEGRIVILGSGGTAAAIAAWFVRAGFRNVDLLMVAGQPTFFTRVSNLFENRVFSDDDLWGSMSSQAQLGFNERLTRGAVRDAVRGLALRMNRCIIPGATVGRVLQCLR